jgi:hypothetical protein
MTWFERESTPVTEGQEVTGVSREERAGRTLLEGYERLCANVPR